MSTVSESSAASPQAFDDACPFQEPVVSIVSDDAAISQSVAALVESMGLRARGYRSAEEFLDRNDDLQNGCLVTDMHLSGMSGLQILENVSQRHLIAGTIVLTGLGYVPTAVHAMRLGAVMVLQKPWRDQELWEAISQGLVVNSQRRGKQDRMQELGARLNSLTDGERRVLDCLLAGEPNKMISAKLQIGLRTVEARRHAIMSKLRVHSVAELVRVVCEFQTLIRLPDFVHAL